MGCRASRYLSKSKQAAIAPLQMHPHTHSSRTATAHEEGVWCCVHLAPCATWARFAKCCWKSIECPSSALPAVCSASLQTGGVAFHATHRVQQRIDAAFLRCITRVILWRDGQKSVQIAFFHLQVLYLSLCLSFLTAVDYRDDILLPTGCTNRDKWTDYRSRCDYLPTSRTVHCSLPLNPGP